MSRNNKGFTLIEVLLSLIILTVAITSINIAFKQFTTYKQRVDKYKNIYLTTLSIKDMIESKNLSDGLAGSGELNGLKYSYTVKLIDKGANITGYSEETKTIEEGSFEVYLYKINLKVENREYSFYKTQYKKVKSVGIPGEL